MFHDVKHVCFCVFVSFVFLWTHGKARLLSRWKQRWMPSLDLFPSHRKLLGLAKDSGDEAPSSELLCRGQPVSGKHVPARERWTTGPINRLDVSFSTMGFTQLWILFHESIDHGQFQIMSKAGRSLIGFPCHRIP